MMDYFLPSDVAKLVLGYLSDEQCIRTKQVFLEECIHLDEYRFFCSQGELFMPTMNSYSLIDILEEYGELRVIVKKLSNTFAWLNVRESENLVTAFNLILKKCSDRIEEFKNSSLDQKGSVCPQTISAVNDFDFGKVLPSANNSIDSLDFQLPDDIENKTVNDKSNRILYIPSKEALDYQPDESHNLVEIEDDVVRKGRYKRKYSSLKRLNNSEKTRNTIISLYDCDTLIASCDVNANIQKHVTGLKTLPDISVLGTLRNPKILKQAGMDEMSRRLSVSHIKKPAPNKVSLNANTRSRSSASRKGHAIKSIVHDSKPKLLPSSQLIHKYTLSPTRPPVSLADPPCVVNLYHPSSEVVKPQNKALSGFNVTPKHPDTCDSSDRCLTSPLQNLTTLSATEDQYNTSSFPCHEQHTYNPSHKTDLSVKSSPCDSKSAISIKSFPEDDGMCLLSDNRNQSTAPVSHSHQTDCHVSNQSDCGSIQTSFPTLNKVCSLSDETLKACGHATNSAPNSHPNISTSAHRDKNKCLSDLKNSGQHSHQSSSFHSRSLDSSIGRTMTAIPYKNQIVESQLCTSTNSVFPVCNTITNCVSKTVSSPLDMPTLLPEPPDEHESRNASLSDKFTQNQRSAPICVPGTVAQANNYNTYMKASSESSHTYPTDVNINTIMPVQTNIISNFDGGIHNARLDNFYMPAFPNYAYQTALPYPSHTQYFYQGTHSNMKYEQTIASNFVNIGCQENNTRYLFHKPKIPNNISMGDNSFQDSGVFNPAENMFNKSANVQNDTKNTHRAKKEIGNPTDVWDYQLRKKFLSTSMGKENIVKPSASDIDCQKPLKKRSLQKSVPVITLDEDTDTEKGTLLTNKRKVSDQSGDLASDIQCTSKDTSRPGTGSEETVRDKIPDSSAIDSMPSKKSKKKPMKSDGEMYSRKPGKKYARNSACRPNDAHQVMEDVPLQISKNESIKTISTLNRDRDIDSQVNNHMVSRVSKNIIASESACVKRNTSAHTKRDDNELCSIVAVDQEVIAESKKDVNTPVISKMTNLRCKSKCPRKPRNKGKLTNKSLESAIKSKGDLPSYSDKGLRSTGLSLSHGKKSSNVFQANNQNFLYSRQPDKLIPQTEHLQKLNAIETSVIKNRSPEKLVVVPDIYYPEADFTVYNPSVK